MFKPKRLVYEMREYRKNPYSGNEDWAMQHKPEEVSGMEEIYGESALTPQQISTLDRVEREDDVIGMIVTREEMKETFDRATDSVEQEIHQGMEAYINEDSNRQAEVDALVSDAQAAIDGLWASYETRMNTITRDSSYLDRQKESDLVVETLHYLAELTGTEELYVAGGTRTEVGQAGRLDEISEDFQALREEVTEFQEETRRLAHTSSAAERLRGFLDTNEENQTFDIAMDEYGRRETKKLCQGESFYGAPNFQQAPDNVRAAYEDFVRSEMRMNMKIHKYSDDFWWDENIGREQVRWMFGEEVAGYEPKRLSVKDSVAEGVSERVNVDGHIYERRISTFEDWHATFFEQVHDLTIEEARTHTAELADQNAKVIEKTNRFVSSLTRFNPSVRNDGLAQTQIDLVSNAERLKEIANLEKLLYYSEYTEVKDIEQESERLTQAYLKGLLTEYQTILEAQHTEVNKIDPRITDNHPILNNYAIIKLELETLLGNDNINLDVATVALGKVLTFATEAVTAYQEFVTAKHDQVTEEINSDDLKAKVEKYELQTDYETLTKELKELEDPYTEAEVDALIEELEALNAKILEAMREEALAKVAELRKKIDEIELVETRARLIEELSDIERAIRAGDQRDIEAVMMNLFPVLEGEIEGLLAEQAARAAEFEDGEEAEPRSGYAPLDGTLIGGDTLGRAEGTTGTPPPAAPPAASDSPTRSREAEGGQPEGFSELIDQDEVEGLDDVIHRFLNDNSQDGSNAVLRATIMEVLSTTGNTYVYKDGGLTQVPSSSFGSSSNLYERLHEAAGNSSGGITIAPTIIVIAEQQMDADPTTAAGYVTKYAGQKEEFTNEDEEEEEQEEEAPKKSSGSRRSGEGGGDEGNHQNNAPEQGRESRESAPSYKKIEVIEEDDLKTQKSIFLERMRDKARAREKGIKLKPGELKNVLNMEYKDAKDFVTALRDNKHLSPAEQRRQLRQANKRHFPPNTPHLANTATEAQRYIAAIEFIQREREQTQSDTPNGKINFDSELDSMSISNVIDVLIQAEWAGISEDCTDSGVYRTQQVRLLTEEGGSKLSNDPEVMFEYVVD